ncbi:MAG TPA: TonB-dependent receptor [Candidatus Binatia bacterium]|nr:TonB-dependent receptor [Candidatus Binatia bacterium]
MTVRPGVHTEPVGPDAAAAQAGEATSAGPAAANLSLRRALRVEEMVVTARRREELLQETPISVTALGDDTLREAQVQTLEDLQGIVPNLVYHTTGSGHDAAPFIRGVGALPASFLDQGVGTYVDGVYLARADGSLLDVVDFQRVEVLRGPQGTLFGKNTVGGAINVTTIKPRDRYEASAYVRAGSYGEVDTRAMLNAPIALGALRDKLFSRFTFASFRNDGYTTDTLTGDRYSDRNTLDFYGALRFLPAPGVTFDLTGTWSRDHAHGLGGQCRFVPASAQVNPATGETNNPFNAFLPPGYREACDRSERYRFESEITSPIADVESYGVWGILDWDLARAGAFDDLRLRYTGSWRQQIPRSRSDLDMTAFPVFVYSATGGGPSGGDPTQINGEAAFQQQIQQELQVLGKAWDGRLSLVSGLFLYWEQVDENAALRFLPGNPILDPLGGITENVNRASNRDWALFSQGTADVTDWLSVTAGVRYTQERKSLSRAVTIPLGLSPPDPVLADFSNSATFGAWTPMATVALEAPPAWLEATGFLDWAMPYFTYARGFTGGGINGAGRSDSPLESKSFAPEYANSYEWGIKTSGFQRRASLAFDFFLVDRADQQVLQLVQDRSACPPGDATCVPPTLSIVTNAANSRTRGFEVELEATPIAGLLVSGGVGYTNGKFIDYPDAVDSITNDVINRAGQRFPFVPQWTTHLALQYSWQLPHLAGPPWLRGWLTPRVDWSYVSSIFYFNPEIPGLLQPGYDLVNLRLSYDFNDDRTQLAFWMKNASDSEHFGNALAWPRLTGSVVRYFDAPRTAGVEISQRF